METLNRKSVQPAILIKLTLSHFLTCRRDNLYQITLMEKTRASASLWLINRQLLLLARHTLHTHIIRYHAWRLAFKQPHMLLQHLLLRVSFCYFKRNGIVNALFCVRISFTEFISFSRFLRTITGLGIFQIKIYFMEYSLWKFRNSEINNGVLIFSQDKTLTV